MKSIVLAIGLAMSLSSIQASSGSLTESEAQDQKSYHNPIIKQSVPDPTVIRAKDGYFYLYGTEDTRNMPIFKSKDMVSWEYVGTVFTDETRPAWDGPHSLWAPEIRYINGQYVLYYSWARWGREWESNVGVAVSPTPTGPFEDKGCLIDADAPEIHVKNSIDQFYIEDGGKHYLFWGSFSGIYVVELESDGLSVKRKSDGTPVFKKQVCGNAFEGVNIYKKGKYYYLLASVGSCCVGAESTYRTVVGRSENILGPYVDRNGKNMLDNAFEVVIQGNENWAGVGHNAIIQKDDAGQEWIIYHGYLRKEAEKGRVVLLDKLLWSEDGWPYVKGKVPQEEESYPKL